MAYMLLCYFYNIYNCVYSKRCYDVLQFSLQFCKKNSKVVTVDKFLDISEKMVSKISIIDDVTLFL